MKRSRFRLDSIVRLRESELSRARSELAARLRARAEVAAARERWLASVREAEERLGAQLGEGLRAGEAQVTAFAIDASRAAERAAAMKLRDCEEAVSAARREVTDARRRLRALEIMRERFRASEREREIRQEGRALDEVAARISARETSQ